MTPIEPGSPEWTSLAEHARESVNRSCWDVGDDAVRATWGAPGPSTHGGDRKSTDYGLLIDATDLLRKFSEDTEIPFPSLQRYRLVSLAWPPGTRNSACSHRVHLLLAGQPDRFSLLRDGMKIDEAQAIVAERRAAHPDPARTTLLSILAGLTEVRHRLRVSFRDTIALSPDDNGKDHILADLGEIETLTGQFRDFLTGMNVNEAINMIMEGT
jgi:hypothetical protein